MADFLKEYTMLAEIGRGGYATVYKVRHDRLGYVRAIRVLNETIVNEQSDTYEKFLDECRLLLRLGNGNHPNIVHIYQPKLLENKALVEMDFVDGFDITHYLERQRYFLPIDEVLRMVTQVSSALAYCHEDIYKYCMDMDADNLECDPNDGKKILLSAAKKRELIEKYRVIHNDIHSGNIMRRENGDFVLLDFGLAIEGNTVVRSSRRKNGAPEYKSPEKWNDESTLTVQSDIYSFGIVMYEYLCGKVPFEFDKTLSNTIKAEYELSEKHQNAMPPSMFEARKRAYETRYEGIPYEKDYPDWLEKAILKCLEKNPNDRFRSGRELYDFISENLENTKLTADSISQSTEIEDYRRKVNELVAENESLKDQLARLTDPTHQQHESGSEKTAQNAASAAASPDQPFSPHQHADNDMVRCPSCSRYIVSTAKFCKYCGKFVTSAEPSVAQSHQESSFQTGVQRCPNCGSEVGATSRFCKRCGHKIM